MDGFFSFPVQWGMSGTEIYDNFQGGNADRLYSAAEIVKGLIKNYETRADSIKNLTSRMETAWQGDASGAAQRGAGPLAVEHGYAAPEMNTAQTLVRSQVEVFDATKGAVVQIPPEPEKPGLWDNFTTLGGAGRTYDQKMTEYNAANDHNVTMMSNYEATTSTNTSGMPQSYGSITPDFSAVGVEQKKPPIIEHRWEPTQHETGEPRQTSETTTRPTGTRDPVQPPVQLPPDRPGPTDPSRPTDPRGPGQTDPGKYVPPGPPQRPGPGPGPGPGQGLGYGPGFGPGYLPAAGFGPTGGGGGSDGGSGRGGAGARGPGGGAGGFAEEGGRPGGRGGAAGMGAGAAAAEAAAGRGAGGAGGRGGGMPMGGGGGRGQGGEDGEHQRPSFLVEADPDETFGTDEVTAPPVIGE